MQMLNFDSFESAGLELPKFDIKETIEAFNKNFKSAVAPENGVYGVEERLRDDGTLEKLFRDADNHLNKEFYKDGIIVKSYAKTDTGTKTIYFDDLGNDYLTKVSIKSPDGTTVQESTLSLKPNNQIVKSNFYAETDGLGRPVLNRVTDLDLSPERQSLNSNLKDSSYKNYDQRGHLIADSLGGPNTKENIVAQMDEVNLGKMKQVENIAREQKKQGHVVDYEVKTNYADNTNRPSSFEPKITVDGKEIDLPEDLKKIYNDNMSDVQKTVTNVKETATRVANDLKPMHEAGIETGMIAAGITMAVSTVDNISQYVSGDISAEEMVINIAKDTGTAGAVGYGTGFVTEAIASGMRESSHELIKSLSKAGVPAAVVSVGVQSFDSIVDFAQGEIDGSELVYDLGDNTMKVVGGMAGAAVATAVVGAALPAAAAVTGTAAVAIGVTTVATSMAGSMVGTAVAAEAYKTAVAVGSEGAEVLADKTREMASKAVDLAKEVIPDKLDTITTALNDFSIANALPFSLG